MLAVDEAGEVVIFKTSPAVAAEVAVQHFATQSFIAGSGFEWCPPHSLACAGLAKAGAATVGTRVSANRLNRATRKRIAPEIGTRPLPRNR